MAAAKWRGRGAAQGGAKSAQVLEFQFQEMANALFESLMNWHASPQELQAGWNQVIQLRASCMKAYGGSVKGMPAGAVAAAGGGDVNWKGELTGAFGKANKRSLTKEEIVYETQDAEGGGYITVLSCEFFARSQQYQGEGVGKKHAEAAAAKNAMQSEFPDRYVALSGGAIGAGNKGQKRKAGAISPIAAPAHESDAKSKLAQANQLLIGIGEQAAKGDIMYECQEAEGGFVATVTLQKYDPNTGYQGEPAASRKEAEQNAAQACLSTLNDTLAPLRADHEAKKKAKNQEALAALKEKTDAKKEAAKAAKANGLA